MNLAHLVCRTASTYPDRPAVLLGDKPVHNYSQLAARAGRLAGYFQDHLDLVPGDRVALFMHNCVEYLELMYGAWWAGLVIVPINAKLHALEAAYILQDSGARAIFVSKDFAADIEPLISDLSLCSMFIPDTPAYEAIQQAAPITVAQRLPDDSAWLFYTSGTTGKPKGVVLSSRNLMAMSTCYFIDVDEVCEQDVMVYAAPMSHGAGLYNFMQVLKGGRHVIPESQGFDCDELIALSYSLGQLTLFAAPTMVKRLVRRISETGADASGFKTIVYGGGPMYVEDIRKALEVMGDRFVQIYGQGESPMAITVLPRQVLADRSHPQWAERIGSVGYAQALVQVRVVDQSGQDQPVGETGEVIVRGDPVMSNYWNAVQATADTLREGWLYTGDMGAFDPDGFLTLKDRSKDLIISGGSNIYPREVEEVLLAHPEVQEVSVIGRANAEWGEDVIACVVLNPGSVADKHELDLFCLERIARFKRPKDYLFLQALPKNNYGKVLKAALREHLLADTLGSA